MALSTELYGLKSAGTYRFERDQSVTMDTVTPLENVRMLVGFSKIGPFNTPVFIQNTREFINTFGDIDRTLEKKGSYFHRSCLAALSAGPIYCLNLLKLTDDDTVDTMKFSTSASSDKQDIDPQSIDNHFKYSGMYNIENFYTPSEESFLYTIGRKNYYEEDSTNHILNFTNIGKTPVSVIVTRANAYNSTNFKVTAQEWYGKGNVPEYLHETSYMSDYMVDVYVLEGNWGGDFSDEEGCYYKRLASDFKFGKYFDKEKGLIRRKNETDTTDTMLTQFLNEPDVKLIGKYTGSLIPGLVDKNGRNIYIEYMINSDTATNGLMCSVNEQIFDGDVKLDGAQYGIDMVGNSLYDVMNNTDTTFDGNVRFLSYAGSIESTETDEKPYKTQIEVIRSIQIGNNETLVAKDNEFFIPTGISTDDAYECVKVGNFILSIDSELTNNDPDGNVHHRLTRIAEITGISNSNGEILYRKVSCQDNVCFSDESDTTSTESDTTSTECFYDITDFFTHYNVFMLSGFKLKKSHMPDGSNERQHEILDLLSQDSKDSNLFNALIDRELIQFRYLVDTFGFGIEESCKDQYTKLCMERKSAFAIINAPSSNDFKNSEDPSFIDKNNSVSAEFIAKGGNPDKNPTFLFKLPDVAHGATWGAYYYPYLKVYSNYTTINVPPAAYVSNLFVAKYETGQPWNAVAGQNRGVISGNNVVGVESTLVRDNRDWLEPAGINSIIYQNGVGCVIYANKTAKQTPKSALSEINCREACIYIQDGVEKILRNYLFEVNNAQTRLEIKTLVDNFIDMVKNNGGVYDFKTVMDKSNNDDEVIDHNMGVIDIFIEPARAMDILVQKLTILRTGVIESGTFE